MRASIRTVPWLVAGAAIGLVVAGFNPISRGTAVSGGEPTVKGPDQSLIESKPTRKKSGRPADPEEQAIRDGAAAFAKAYNSHDAKAVAKLFALKAEFIDEDGKIIKGRDAIEKNYSEIFSAKPKCRIEIHVASVRTLTSNIAVEEGTVRSTPAPDELAGTSSYLAVNIKVDGKWVVASVKDTETTAADLSAHDHLKELGWLVGDWVDESPHATVKSSIRWDASQNYLIQNFQLQADGGISMRGTMRIAWDPLVKQYHSWVFDSQGGFAEGFWPRDGDSWIVRSHGVTPKGTAASGTAVYRPTDPDTIAWRSYDRVVGGEKTADIDEIIIKRQPPKPLN